MAKIDERIKNRKILFTSCLLFIYKEIIKSLATKTPRRKGIKNIFFFGSSSLCGIVLFFFLSLQAIGSSAAEKKVTNKEIGIQVSTITEEYMQYLKLDSTKGVIVLGVLPGSPADNGGMHPGDVILGIAEFPISNIEEYEEVVKKLEGRGDFSIMIRDREGPFSFIQIIKHE